MKTMASSQNIDLQEFLRNHKIDKDKDVDKTTTSTHTRIGDTKLNVYGGNYNIAPEELPNFYKAYYDYVFVKGKNEFLTEKQLSENGCILVDFDFRYDYDVKTRIHTKEHISDMISLYLDELKEFLVFEEGKAFPIFIMEKTNVNRDEKKNVTKDGIHMIIGVQMDHIMQLMLRERIMNKIGDIWELPLKNDWNGVFDEGISKGTTNWQLYGSRKPGFEAYKLTYYIVAEIDKQDDEFTTIPQNIKDFEKKLSENLCLLSAQYDKRVKFEINPKIMDEYNNKKMANKKKAPAKKKSAKKVNIEFEEVNETEEIEIEDIVNYERLQKAVDIIMNNLKTKNEQIIKDVHEYTQILPKKYYEPGSHLLNRQVAFALKNTDERLFLSWVMLRSKADDFDYSSIPKLHNDWNVHFNKNDSSVGLTKSSIIYWAKQDAYEDYLKISKSKIDYYVEYSLSPDGVADWDYAHVLYHMFKDKYACTDPKRKIWHRFEDHRWKEDDGEDLRTCISKDLFALYSEKQSEYMVKMHSIDPGSDIYGKLQTKIKIIASICTKLKKTADKNNIMREAIGLFKDEKFNTKKDSNPYLMGFTNGVINFKNKIFRNGYREDYITKSTNIPYIPFDKINEDKQEIINKIQIFMSQLFPIENVCKYMWDHLASCLIGVKKEQVFTIYRGSGSNGKSLLTKLMAKSLGGEEEGTDGNNGYYGVVPVPLITDKRKGIGGTSSEIAQLKGVRYAVISEPKKGDVINEGVMKDLTGGDPIQARELYGSTITFKPQFSLVVCTNALFEVKSNDDGTWRRMKLVDYVSKFVSEGEIYKDNTNYVFPKDTELGDNLSEWAPVFMSMLVKRAFETEGKVVDCPEIVAASNSYRQKEDCIAEFINDKIVEKDGCKIKQEDLSQVFKIWFTNCYGNTKPPKLSELVEAIDNKFKDAKFKKNNKKYWTNLKLVENDDDEDDDF
jgi:P4 family phage/plasmid primase-like protien